MEKYTIDIDKVLDDFEETEALNVNKNKNVGDSIQPSIFVNYDVNQVNLNQENVLESSVNEDNTVKSCDRNSLISDKSKVPQNSVHNINCLQNFEKSKGSDGINCNFNEKDKLFNLAIKSEILGCMPNICSTSVSVLSELTGSNSQENFQSLSLDEERRNQPLLSNDVKNKLGNDKSLICGSESTNESSESPLVKDNIVISPGNSSVKDVFADKPCNLPLSDLNCDSEMGDHSEPLLKTCKDISDVELSTESNDALVICTNVEQSVKVNAFANSSSSVSNEQKPFSELSEPVHYASQPVKEEVDVKSGATSSGSQEERSEVEMPISVSNLSSVENERLDELGYGMHDIHINSESNTESLPKLKKQSCNVDSLAALSTAAAENLVLNRCGCKGGHLPNECSHQEMHPPHIQGCALMPADELGEQRSLAEDSHSASNPEGGENKELNRCGCLGVHPPNVCFQQNGRVRAIPDLDERFSDNDDDSGVSSEEDNSPLFFFNNRMFNYNDGAQIDARNEEVVAAPNFACSSCDNNIDLQEAAVADINNSASPTPAVESEDDKVHISEIFPSGSAVNCQSPNKLTGARSKMEAASEIVNASSDEIVNTENNDLKFHITCVNDLTNECASEAVSEEYLHSNCDNSNKPIDKCTVNTSDIVSIEHANETEIKCDNEIISASAETFSVSADGECSSLHPNVKADNVSYRLPRPTTLDLPSRHIATSQSSEESGTVLSESNNLESLSSDLVPNEMPLNATAPEESPSVNPQSQIGLVKPFWIPDADAPNCMHCGVKFTVIKRRHHCRACGKVLCSRCCNLRAKLAYLNKEDRICHPCFDILSSTSQNESAPPSLADSQSSSSCGSSPNFSPSPQAPNSSFSDKNTWRPHPNNPDDYCSTIPPLQQVQLSEPRPPPTVLVPIGVLKRGNKARREPKQVIFSDGIRPGGDLTDLTEPADVFPVYRRMGRKRVERAISGDASTGSPVSFNTAQRNRQRRILVSDEEGPLPPLVLQMDNDKIKDDKLDWSQILEKMQDDDQKPINFALLKNMHLFVKLTKLDCCFGKECWCFTSHGLCAVGQDEVMVILERTPGENILPRGIIKLFTHIYDSASKGSTFEDLGHIIFPEPVLGSSDHRGFLFVRPTFQCLSKLIVPNTPFLVAILIHKWEVPWAKVFPLRLMLRLGAECRYYPCALVSVRHRKPVFFEIGQTIMSVLADLRNFQFTIPVIPGLVVHMEEKKTCVNIPRNRYDKVMKVLNSNNVEHVLALGSNFSSEADSHLVCMQKEEGDYQTQAINIENTMRRVTGASFIVFSGALKSSSGLSAKFSIVEDGLLVQIPQETMVALHMALRDMKDLTVQCGQINAAEPEEVVIIQWTRDDKKFNIGVRSPIDCKSLEGIPNLRIHNSTDYAGDNFLIRWTEVFFLEVDESGNSIQHELVDPCRLAETVAQSCCMALAPYLDQLAESELTKIGLRVTLDSERDRVEYDIGARGKPLPAMYMNALDCGLIPVILRLSGSAQSEPVSFELIFHILIK